jgi:hypothetical protein
LLFKSPYSFIIIIISMLPSSLLHFTNKHGTSTGYLSQIDTIEDSLRALSILLPGIYS